MWIRRPPFPCANVFAMTTATRVRHTKAVEPEPRKNNPVSIRFPDDVREWLNAYKDETGQSYTEVITEAVTRLRGLKTKAAQRKAAKNAGS